MCDNSFFVANKSASLELINSNVSETKREIMKSLSYVMNNYPFKYKTLNTNKGLSTTTLCSSENKQQ